MQWNVETSPKADALVTNTRGLLLSVLTADCQPVILQIENSVIGIAHAGWRGALNGVLNSTVNKMEALGAERTKFRRNWPSISQNAYEVGPDFLKNSPVQIKNKDYFDYSSDTKKYHFDLPNFSNLLKDSISSIEWTGHCTYSDLENFFYRRSCHKKEPDYGRLICYYALRALAYLSSKISKGTPGSSFSARITTGL